MIVVEVRFTEAEFERIQAAISHLKSQGDKSITFRKFAALSVKEATDKIFINKDQVDRPRVAWFDIIEEETRKSARPLPRLIGAKRYEKAY